MHGSALPLVRRRTAARRPGQLRGRAAARRLGQPRPHANADPPALPLLQAGV